MSDSCGGAGIGLQDGLKNRCLIKHAGSSPARRTTSCDPIAADSAAYAYLLGLYLGDGCISAHRRGVQKLRITLDAKYPGIIEECAASMSRVQPVNKVNRVQRPGSVEAYSYSKHWSCLFPQHGSGPKHLRSITLADWQSEKVASERRLFLRGLSQSDGDRDLNIVDGKSYPRYGFTNMSEDIRHLYVDTCESLGISVTTSGIRVRVARRPDVVFMDSFIGPKA